MGCFEYATASAILILGTSSTLRAQVPDYDFTWKTIGAPGNVGASADDFFFLGELGASGRVEHEYRMSQTEVTVAQWFEFANAYAPFAQQNPTLLAFTGRHIYSETGDPRNPQLRMYPGSERYPADMTWLNAARYCNWLHNGKVNQTWAFETGAYDMSSFVRGSDGTWTGNAVRLPGATFWIPSADEWIKGMYFDPNKHGPGQAGYWTYPTSSDAIPVSGAPGTPGAQTSAGWYPNKLDYFWVDVASYPATTSPWGLLDGSAGQSEYFEGLSGFGRARTFGSASPMYESFYLSDVLGNYSTRYLEFSGNGFRIASVPSPATALPFLITGLIVTRRRM